jgi:DNA-directed RNA polymerase specialized sigma24 family protein
MTSLVRAERPRTDAISDLLEDYGRERGRGRALRAQLARRFPERSEEEIEDAVQSACQLFLAEEPGITESGRAYAWLRTVAYRQLLHELEAGRRFSPVDPTQSVIGSAEAEGPGPVEELIALEDEVELGLLVEEVAAGLSDRRREIFALWAAGHKRPEIAERLGMSDRAVKKALEQIMAAAREVLGREAGGGCAEGGSLVLRMACGLTEAGEATRARLHLEDCGRCTTFSERLNVWREKAVVVLPPVGLEATNPGVVERTVGRIADAAGSVRRQLVSGGTHVREQATLSGYGRGADPTPLVGVRPGAVVAVVAGCIAIGGGATYCAHEGVSPLGAATELIAGGEDRPDPGPQPSREEAAADEPVEQPAEEQPAQVPTYEPAEEPATKPTPAPTEEAKTKSEPEPAVHEAEAEPVVEEVAPPPEQSFEPASPDYTAVESSSASSGSESSSSSTAGSSKAKAVPANESPQFGGP